MDPNILKSQIILYDSFSKTNSNLCIYHLVGLSNFNFLHNSCLIHFPLVPFHALYPLCSILLYLHIMSFIVSSLSLKFPHLLFCNTWILAFTQLVLISFCYKKKPSFSFEFSDLKPCYCLFECNFANLPLEISLQLFLLLFLFSSYCGSLCPYIVNAVISPSLSF